MYDLCEYYTWEVSGVCMLHDFQSKGIIYLHCLCLLLWQWLDSLHFVGKFMVYKQADVDELVIQQHIGNSGNGYTQNFGMVYGSVLALLVCFYILHANGDFSYEHRLHHYILKVSKKLNARLLVSVYCHGNIKQESRAFLPGTYHTIH